MHFSSPPFDPARLCWGPAGVGLHRQAREQHLPLDEARAPGPPERKVTGGTRVELREYFQGVRSAPRMRFYNPRRN